MASWNQLEEFLSRLVERVGGTSYILRTSDRRHLAPRPPADYVSTLLKAMSLQRKQPIDGADGDTDRDAIRAARRYSDLVTLFGKQSAALDAAVGADFVKKGPGKRYVNRQADLPFIAERFLSAYLLVISFDDAGVIDAGGAILALERARAVISDMLEDLPPDDDGDQALSNAKRPS